MRWVTFFILLYVAYALQISHLGGLLLGPTPDAPWPIILYLPLLAVFYAMFAADAGAPLAAVCCGLAYDMGNKDYAGTTMIPLALVVLLILRVRLAIFREHALSHGIITLLAILLMAGLSTLFRKLLGAPLYEAGVWPHMLHLAGDAVYTAMVAPVVFWVLFRVPKMLGFSPTGTKRKS